MPEQKYMSASEFAEKFFEIKRSPWNASSWFKSIGNAEVLYKAITGQMQIPLTLNDEALKFTENERELYEQIKMAKSDPSPEAQNFLHYAQVISVISVAPSQIKISDLYSLIQIANNGVLDSKTAYQYLMQAYWLSAYDAPHLTNAVGNIVVALLQSPHLTIDNMDEIAQKYKLLPPEVRQQLLDGMLKKLDDLVEEFVQGLSGVPNTEIVNTIQNFTESIAHFATRLRGGYTEKSHEYATLTELAEQLRHDFTPEKLYGMGPDFIPKRQESLARAAASAKSELQSVRGQMSEKDARIAELERQLQERDQELNALRTENRNQNEELNQLNYNLQQMQAEYEKQIAEIKGEFEQYKVKAKDKNDEQDRIMKILEMKIGIIKMYLQSFDQKKGASLTRGRDLAEIGERFKNAMLGDPKDPKNYNWIKEMETMLAKRKTEQMQGARI